VDKAHCIRPDTHGKVDGSLWRIDGTTARAARLVTPEAIAAKPSSASLRAAQQRLWIGRQLGRQDAGSGGLFG